MPSSGEVQITYPGTGPFDAITRHGQAMAKALDGFGISSTFDAEGVGAIWRPRPGISWLVVAYMPYAYARWGFAPRLIAASSFRAHARGDPRLALFVHEMYSRDARSLRLQLMTRWHRAQIEILAKAADLVFASTEANVADLRRLAPNVQVRHVPIPASIEPVGLSREQARKRIFVDEGDFVVGIFGGSHEARSLDHASLAVTRLAEALECRVVLLNLGVGAPDLHVPGRVHVVKAGGLPDAEMSALLAACDLYLAPFVDGVSTRRTTLAAALAHGLPVLGTSGPETDALFLSRPDAMVLIDAGDVKKFADAAVSLAHHNDARRTLGDSARDLYGAHLSWQANVGSIAACFEGGSPA